MVNQNIILDELTKILSSNLDVKENELEEFREYLVSTCSTMIKILLNKKLSSDEIIKIASEIVIKNSDIQWNKVDDKFKNDDRVEELIKLSNLAFKYAKKYYETSYIDENIEEERHRIISEFQRIMDELPSEFIPTAKSLYSETLLDLFYACGDQSATSLRLGRIIF